MKLSGQWMVLIVAGTALHILADEFTWTGLDSNNNTSWVVAGNWSSSGGGYPGEGDVTTDTVTIPSDFSGSNYPRFDATTAITIKSFKVLNQPVNVTVLEFAAHTSSRVLKISDPDGLSPGGPAEGGNLGGHVKLYRHSELWLLGGGVLAMQGNLIFNSDNASHVNEQEMPELVLGDGTTLYIDSGRETTGNVIKSEGNGGGWIHGEIESPDGDETLVVQLNMEGSFLVAPEFAMLGRITTHDGNQNTANTLRLLCLPKLLYGAITVTGHANKPGTLILDAATVTSGADVNVENYGVLKVNRHFITWGSVALHSRGLLEVKADMYFEAGRELEFDVVCTAVD